MTRRLLLLIAVTTLSVVALFSFGFEAVWVGYFPLTVTVDNSDFADQRTIFFTTCWTKSDAKAAMESGINGEFKFHPAEDAGPNRYTVFVPTSGRDGGLFGIEHSYHEAKFLVVRYMPSNAVVPRRKLYAIPAGRGPRELQILLD